MAVGPNLEGYGTGQQVFIAPNIGCGHCRECVTGNNNRCMDFDAIGITLDGAFAEHLRVPARAVAQGNVIPLREDINSAAAALIEPFACVLRGQNAVGLRTGETVLVIGAGPIGIMHVLLAKLRGAGRVLVSEPLSVRGDQAVRMGADRVVNPTEEDLAGVLNEETHGRGAEVVIVAAPSPAAQESALQFAAVGGRINFFGSLPKEHPAIQFDSNLVHNKELLVTGTTGCSTDDCMRAAGIVNSGRIDLSGLVTRVFPLSKALEALLAAESRASLKIVLEP